jgi:16S rRNA (guanine527-N7)-methyltransferase
MALTVPPGGFRPLVDRLLSEAGSPGTDHFVSAVPALCRLLDLLVEWNSRLDLTAARTPEELVDLTLADAVALALRHRPGHREWVDVGSGAGAPGLPLALLEPALSMTLVEPRTKRVAFLRSVIGTLGRQDIRVLRERSDALPDKQWDSAVSRATLPPPEWLREGARLARSAVWLLIARAEVPLLAGWRLSRCDDYVWPLTGVARKVLSFEPELPA